MTKKPTGKAINNTKNGTKNVCTTSGIIRFANFWTCPAKATER